jgi:3',5'-cyclic AMP phosphodiesterase CpdA
MPEVKTDATHSLNNAASLPSSSFSLAHISDLHLTSLKDVRVSQLLNKRMLGYLSWWHKRRFVHRRDIVESLTNDLRDIQPDHIAVTGDLTHVGLPGEFADAGKWLKTLGAPSRITVIPGNHEAYAGRDWIKSCSMWAPYLESDSNEEDIFKTADFFPSLRIRGKIALIGLCSAIASPPFLAVGSLGRTQLSSLETLLRKTGRQGLFRVILIHHKPLPGNIKWRKRLVDSNDFIDILARNGAEMVLHGHTHTSSFSQIPTPNGNIPVIGAPSGSEMKPSAGKWARYNIYRICDKGSLTMTVRGYSGDLRKFITEQEVTLDIQ